MFYREMRAQTRRSFSIMSASVSGETARHQARISSVSYFPVIAKSKLLSPAQ